MRLRRAGVGAVATGMLLAVIGLSPGFTTHASAAAVCTGGTNSDFNGDGVRDIAIADPEATVNGVAQAGLVRVVLGGGDGVQEISQASPGMNAAPEKGDEFGRAIAAGDFDKDGCTDLAVGVPQEDILKDGVNLVDAGAVYIIHGSPTGLTSTIDGFSQAGFLSTNTNEAYDFFGWSLAAGTSSSGDPYLVIGSPGEDVVSNGVTYKDAGCIQYMIGSTRVTVDQDDPGVLGAVEENDQFGYSVAATNQYFAVGAPGEASGTVEFAGGVTVFKHTLTDGRPTFLTGVTQDSDGMSGTAEAGDEFGTSVAMTGLRPSTATSNTDALLAIGTPGEDGTTLQDVGMAAVLRIQPDGTRSEIYTVSQNTTGVDGDQVAGDHFGERVSLANTDTSVVTTAATAKLAVSIPGADVGSAMDAGAVQVFSALGVPGDTDQLITRGDGYLPGTAKAREYVGMGLASTATDLYIGLPYTKGDDETTGIAVALPWSDLASGTKGTAKTYRPGNDGLPAADAAFGAVIR